ncbi:copper resistance protein CopC [Georgenia yuyongxinii]|uniref:Copper resistance protein CopC n=1 Tax=Georgenia yuyongxinii TaxID=2589797 RepID=A0A5B8C6R2_9MICO|nr:copper resistance CopC family protein [Georgenia yuyongxinii]QDC26273.1 copper resistance protein CopC [Georgenia yuyongxinii]
MSTRLVRTFPSFPALLAALLTALVLLGVAAAPAAQAHDALTGSSPASGETLDAAPQEVTLTFNNDLLDATQAIVVADAGGQTVAEGSPTIEGGTATFALPALAGGDYTVTWSVVSSDGHRIDGEYGFTVTAAAAEPTTAPEPTASAEQTAAPEMVSGQDDATAGAATEEPSDNTDGGQFLPLWLVLLLSVGALGGVVAVAVRFWRSNDR